MPPEPGKKERNRKSQLVLRWIIYFTLALLLLHEATGSGQIQECMAVDASAQAMSHSDYRTLVKYAIPEPAQAHRVIIVAIGSAEPSEIKSDFCTQRLFVARLIERLTQLHASVVALDRFYGNLTCSSGETEALLKAAHVTYPVVTLAVRTRLIPMRERKDPRICLEPAESFDLGLDKSRLGITRLDADTRRIPLQWPLVISDVTHQTEQPSADSFVFVTARAADKESVETPLLQNALAASEQPFSTMTKIPHYSALEVICGKRANTGTWRNCANREPIEGFNGAVVVVGEHSGDQDTHPTIQNPDLDLDVPDPAPDGLVYGVDLQANYIAALLDKRYYLPALTEHESEAFILVFFVVLQVLFWKVKPLAKAFLIGVLFWVLIFGFSLGLLAFKRYLLTVWVQGINFLTILVSWLEHWAATME